MPRYVIEREFPGAARLSADQWRAMSKQACDILRGMGPEIQWVQTYVADDKVYCVYIAKNEDQIREHARLGQFPVDRISRVDTIIDPVTAEPKATAQPAPKAEEPMVESV